MKLCLNHYRHSHILKKGNIYKSHFEKLINEKHLEEFMFVIIVVSVIANNVHHDFNGHKTN